MCKRERKIYRIAGLFCLLLVFISTPGLGAVDLGVTAATSTFILDSGAQYAYAPVPPGLYCRAGLTWLPGKHLEIEIFHLPQLTPRFYSRVFWGLGVGYWLLERKESAYFNLSTSVGVLYGNEGTLLLDLEISPFIFGSPRFRYSTRLATLGVLMDIQQSRVFMKLQLLALTLYL
jgi:hypothetical protein